jgi:DNA-binding PadR family transcriptional regulator
LLLTRNASSQSFELEPKTVVFALAPGTFYGAIHRLLEHEWIERLEQEDTSRDKQAYRLTALGRMQLLAELARLRHIVITLNE